MGRKKKRGVGRGRTVMLGSAWLGTGRAYPLGVRLRVVEEVVSKRATPGELSRTLGISRTTIDAFFTRLMDEDGGCCGAGRPTRGWRATGRPSRVAKRRRRRPCASGPSSSRPSRST